MPIMGDESDPQPGHFFFKADMFGQVGNQGLHRFSGLNRGEYLNNLRSGPRAAKVWAEMGNDPVIGGMLRQIVMVLRRIEWNVEAQTSDAADIERADFIQSCMDDMSIPWDQMVADALSMLNHGFSYLEIVYKRRLGPAQKDPRKRSDANDGKIGWRKFIPIPQDTIVDWDMDDEGGIQAALQQTGYGPQTAVPIDKSVLFRTDYGSPWGQSILRAAYTAWWQKKKIEEAEAIWIERDLVGLPVFEIRADIASDPTRYAEYQNIIRNLRYDEQMGLIIPQEYDDNGNPAIKFYLTQSGGTRTIDIGAVVMRKNTDITMSVMQDVMMLGHTRVGTQALATEKRDMSEVALLTWIDEIASVLNTHAIPRLLALNGFPLEDSPKLVPGELRRADLEMFSRAVKDISQAGIDLVPGGAHEVDDVNFFRRYVGLPPVDPADWEEMQALNAEREDALREAQAQAAQQRQEQAEGDEMDAPPEGTMPDGSQVDE